MRTTIRAYLERQMGRSVRQKWQRPKWRRRLRALTCEVRRRPASLKVRRVRGRLWFDADALNSLRHVNEAMVVIFAEPLRRSIPSESTLLSLFRRGRKPYDGTPHGRYIPLVTR